MHIWITAATAMHQYVIIYISSLIRYEESACLKCIYRLNPLENSCFWTRGVRYPLRAFSALSPIQVLMARWILCLDEGDWREVDREMNYNIGSGTENLWQRCFRPTNSKMIDHPAGRLYEFKYFYGLLIFFTPWKMFTSNFPFFHADFNRWIRFFFFFCVKYQI